jgi:pyruvate dehydrogenase E1 component
MYLFKKGPGSKKPRVQLLGSGTIFIEVIAAAKLLAEDWGVDADLWSCPSFTELARDGQSCERWNRLHPTETARFPHVARRLAETQGPVVAATDYVRAFAEQIRPYINKPYTVLGTDGFGRSDTRANLRSFFEVDRYHVTVTALYSLVQSGEFEASKVDVAIAKYGINPEATSPWLI